jgi:PadR family transcriptional regulator, regulatory protein PadR
MDLFDSWSVQFRKGIVELMVLRLLESRSLYGYAIVRELKSRGAMVAGEATIYPVLRRLEADGLVESEWSHEAPGNPRRYYRATDKGREFLRRALREWRRVDGALAALEGDGHGDGTDR